MSQLFAGVAVLSQLSTVVAALSSEFFCPQFVRVSQSHESHSQFACSQSAIDSQSHELQFACPQFARVSQSHESHSQFACSQSAIDSQSHELQFACPQFARVSQEAVEFADVVIALQETAPAVIKLDIIIIIEAHARIFIIGFSLKCIFFLQLFLRFRFILLFLSEKIRNLNVSAQLNI